MNRFKLLLNLAMLSPHHRSRSAFSDAGFLFPQRKQQILLPHDMTLQADLECFEGFLGLGKVSLLQLLKGLEQFVQSVMVLLIEYSDRLLFTHDLTI